MRGSEGGIGLFAYSEEVTERYPTIRAGVIRATGLSNGPSSPELLDAYRAEQRARLRSAGLHGDRGSAVDRRLAPRALAAFGAKPTQYRSAAVAAHQPESRTESRALSSATPSL